MDKYRQNFLFRKIMFLFDTLFSKNSVGKDFGRNTSAVKFWTTIANFGGKNLAGKNSAE